MAEVNLMKFYPRSKRPIEERGRFVTDADRAISRQFGKDYFDGDRMHGYGGYSYHPRFWTDTVRLMRDYYSLAPDASILDVGCAKGFMLHDFKLLMPEAKGSGLDISEYALEHSIESVRPFLQLGNAKQLPFPDKSFDLVISINTVHNLELEQCKTAIREIERVARGKSFLAVDAWHNDEELENLRKWVLTCVTAMHVDDWKQLFKELGYSGDYYWTMAVPE